MPSVFKYTNTIIFEVRFFRVIFVCDAATATFIYIVVVVGGVDAPKSELLLTLLP